MKKILTICILVILYIMTGCGSEGNITTLPSGHLTSQGNDGTLTFTISEQSIIPLETSYIYVTIQTFNDNGAVFKRTLTLSDSETWYTARTETAIPTGVPLRIEFQAISEEEGWELMSHRYEYVTIEAGGTVELNSVTLGATIIEDPDFPDDSILIPCVLPLYPKKKLLIGNSDDETHRIIMGDIENSTPQWTPSDTLPLLTREGNPVNRVTQFTAYYTFSPRAAANSLIVVTDGGAFLVLMINYTGGTNVTVE